MKRTPAQNKLRNARDRKRYRTDPAFRELKKSRAREFNKIHRKQRAAYYKKYYAAHRAERIADCRAWYYKNRAHVLKRMAEKALKNARYGKSLEGRT